MGKISVEAAAKEWIELKAQEGISEKRFRELREVLEPALAKAPEQTFELHGFKFTLFEVKARQTFQLADAKKKIAWGILSPFVKKSKPYTQIKMTWKGDDEKAA